MFFSSADDKHLKLKLSKPGGRPHELWQGNAHTHTSACYCFGGHPSPMVGVYDPLCYATNTLSWRFDDIIPQFELSMNAILMCEHIVVPNFSTSPDAAWPCPCLHCCYSGELNNNNTNPTVYLRCLLTNQLFIEAIMATCKACPPLHCYPQLTWTMRVRCALRAAC